MEYIVLLIASQSFSNIPAILHPLEMNLLDACVSQGCRIRNCGCGRGDPHNTPAIGNDLSVMKGRPGMKSQNTLR